MVNVVGLDLSLTSTGLAGPSWTKALKPKKLTGVDRMRWIVAQIIGRISDPANPPTVAIEGPSYGSQHGREHERGGLWWYTVDQLDGIGYPIVVVPPAVLKKYATGNGGAGKDAVLLAASRRFDWFAGGNDEADAIWLVAIAAELAGEPLVTMPAVNRAGLADKVSWIREPVAA